MGAAGGEWLRVSAQQPQSLAGSKPSITSARSTAEHLSLLTSIPPPRRQHRRRRAGPGRWNWGGTSRTDQKRSITTVLADLQEGRGGGNVCVCGMGWYHFLFYLPVIRACASPQPGPISAIQQHLVRCRFDPICTVIIYHAATASKCSSDFFKCRYFVRVRI